MAENCTFDPRRIAVTAISRDRGQTFVTNEPTLAAANAAHKAWRDVTLNARISFMRQWLAKIATVQLTDETGGNFTKNYPVKGKDVTEAVIVDSSDETGQDFAERASIPTLPNVPPFCRRQIWRYPSTTRLHTDCNNPASGAAVRLLHIWLPKHPQDYAMSKG